MTGLRMAAHDAQNEYTAELKSVELQASDLSRYMELLKIGAAGKRVAAAIAKNPNTSTEQLQELLAYDSAPVYAAIAIHPNASAQTLYLIGQASHRKARDIATVRLLPWVESKLTEKPTTVKA